MTVVFRGREMMHLDLGRRLLDRISAALDDAAVLEQAPRQEGRQMSSIFIPKPPTKEMAREAAAKAEAARSEAERQFAGEAEPVQP